MMNFHNWVFTLPFPRFPPSPNSSLSGKLRAERVAEMRRVTRMLVMEIMEHRGIPRATKKRGLQLSVMRAPRQKRMDLDNLLIALKPIVDGMVSAGMFKDDSEEWLTYKNMPIQETGGPVPMVLAEVTETNCNCHLGLWP